MTDFLINPTQYTDRDLIISILTSFYIVDYGFVKRVNPDKTVNVTHAKLLKTVTNESLSSMTTENLEVLTLAGAGFSLNLDIKKGDKVLLLGLKNYIPDVNGVTSPTETKSFMHYTRETMKVIPLCVFNADAKVTINIKDGNCKIATSNKLELNGNSKQFVTWEELNNSLQDLWSAIKTHTHLVSTTGTAVAQSGTAVASTDLTVKTLDISSAKTTTVVTGG